MITNKTPEDWQALQRWTAEILVECGLSAEIEVKCEVARGIVEVDVVAMDQRYDRNYTVFVECKLWESNIPQHVVHAFRSVVADGGANVGYIVSKKGFQSGCYAAVENTVVNLLSWEEFQNEFEQQWYFSYLKVRAQSELSPLLSYIENSLGLPYWDYHLEENEVEEIEKLIDENYELRKILNELLRGEGKLELPLKRGQVFSNPLPECIFEQETYKEFYTLLLELSTPILNKFKYFHELAIERRKLL